MDLHSLVLAGLFVVIIIGIFKGFGENRTITIYKNYDDLGLTFLIPASFVLIMLVFTNLGGSVLIAGIIASVTSLCLLIVLVKNTYLDNGKNFPNTALALITKLPLAVIWILALTQALNPSGKTGGQRRQNRGQALIVLTLLTPIIGGLVADKSGNIFNPRNWIKGRRVGSGIRNNL
tara:strand:+ start:2897 stop:3427 length:531 start_codon:yes stop_codon:yes gene_type:complete